MPRSNEEEKMFEFFPIPCLAFLCYILPFNHNIWCLFSTSSLPQLFIYFILSCLIEGQAIIYYTENLVSLLSRSENNVTDKLVNKPKTCVLKCLFHFLLSEIHYDRNGLVFKTFPERIKLI